MRPGCFSDNRSLRARRERLSENHPGLIAVMAANNETGVLQPWTEVHDLCRSHKVAFFCDAARGIAEEGNFMGTTQIMNLGPWL